MSSPFEAISYFWLWVAFFALLILFVLVGGRARPGFSGQEQQKIKEELGREPILALELGGSVAETQRVLKVSREANAGAAEKFRAAIAWDYLFLFIYPAWIAVGCMIVSRFVSEKGLPGAQLGLFLIIIQPVAALLDAVENYAMLRVLDGPVRSPWPQIARWCALPKFAITIVTGVGYVIIYGIIALVRAKLAGR